ncbi:ABEC4 enzyme, partial [Psophia crepitans]|nr:ABEC4 enzyme [Psophia crepitans]
IFHEYLRNPGTVVKPYFWQGQNHRCAKCPFHIQTRGEARVPYAEFHRVSGFPYRSTATLANKQLLFCELRSFSGRVVQKGHATNRADQDNHPEPTLFEVGGYLDAVTDACANIGYIILYSNDSPCNEACCCCISKIYRVLLKSPSITLCIYFSQLYHAEDSFPTAAWNREALQSFCSLGPRVTLQRLPGATWCYLLCNFVYGVPAPPSRTLADQPNPPPPSRTLADQPNPRQTNNLTGMKPYFRKAFPQAMQGKPALQNYAFSSPSPASQQPLQAMKASLLPPKFLSHSVLFPDVFLPFQEQQLYPRPKDIVRHFKMPKE